MADPLLLAYLAGTIDADGFISLQRKLGPPRKSGFRPYYYALKIGLGETSPVVPDLLYDTFGGWRGMHTPTNRAHRPVFLWQATDRRAGRAITALLPYLRLKHRQGELAIEYLALLDTQVERGPGGVLTNEQIAGREHYWEAISRLNEPRNRRIHHLPERVA